MVSSLTKAIINPNYLVLNDLDFVECAPADGMLALKI